MTALDCSGLLRSLPMVAIASTLPNSKSPASLLQYQSNFCCSSSGGNTDSTVLLRMSVAVLACSDASMEPSAAAISAHIAMLPLANSLFLNWPALVVSWLFISRVLALSESQNAIRGSPWLLGAILRCPIWPMRCDKVRRTNPLTRAAGRGFRLLDLHGSGQDGQQVGQVGALLRREGPQQPVLVR